MNAIIRKAYTWNSFYFGGRRDYTQVRGLWRRRVSVCVALC